jgi:hypothetical protein
MAVVIATAGWFGGQTLAQSPGGSDPDFVPHANACVNNWGIVRIIDGETQVSAQSSTLFGLFGLFGSECQEWERPFQIASEEKVDAVASYVNTASTSTDTSSDKKISVECDPGDRATGGGAEIDPVWDYLVLQASSPTGGGTDSPATGWYAAAVDFGLGSTTPTWSLTAYVICTENFLTIVP